MCSVWGFLCFRIAAPCDVCICEDSHNSYQKICHTNLLLPEGKFFFKKASWRGIACFVVMYLLNSKFPPRFISVDTRTLELLPTQAHKAGPFFLSLWDKSFHYLYGSLWGFWGGSVEIRGQETSPLVWPSLPRPHCVVPINPAWEKTYLPSLIRPWWRTRSGRRRIEH